MKNGAVRGLQIRAGCRDYKSRQEGLQIDTALGISNWGKIITNRGRDFKLVQRHFKSSRNYKSRERLQIGAEQRVTSREKE